MTPEGYVKRHIKRMLDVYAPDVWYDMPVPAGYGKSTVDFICCVRGHLFVIEAKVHGKKPTELQNKVMRDMAKAGADTFVVTGQKDHNKIPEGIFVIDQYITNMLTIEHRQGVVVA